MWLNKDSELGILTMQNKRGEKDTQKHMYTHLFSKSEAEYIFKNASQ